MIDSLSKLVYVAAFALLILLCQYGAETMGRLHYEEQGHTRIFDLAHKYLPDWHSSQWIINILPAALLVYAFIQPKGLNVLQATFFMLMVVLAIRGLTVVSTVLPKHDDCVVKGSGFWNIFQGGGCYDKIFSGHTAFVTLITLNLLKYGYISQPLFWAIALLNGGLILLTRGHYTVDVVLGFIISYLVFDGDYRLLGGARWWN